MADKIYIRRGTKAELDVIVLENGEPGWATDTKEFYMGDGTTSGGIFVAGSGTGVDSLNALIGAITIQGGTGISVTVSGQYIVIDEEAGGLDVDSLNALTGVVTISGAGITEITEEGQKIVVTTTETDDVDSLNSLVGVVTISGAGNVGVTEEGQVIVVSGASTTFWKDAPDEVLSSGITISGDMTYTDLDLSSYISTNAKVVMVALTLEATTMPSGSITLSVRKNGTSTTKGLKAYLNSANGDTNNSINRAFGLVGVDEAGVIEWGVQLGNANTYIANLTIDLMGYLE